MDAEGSESVRLTATVSGWVQGVGFRWSTMAQADRMRLVGCAENLPDGDVLVIAEGPRERCQELLDWLQGKGPRAHRRPGRVESVVARWGPAHGGYRRFSTR